MQIVNLCIILVTLFRLGKIRTTKCECVSECSCKNILRSVGINFMFWKVISNVTEKRDTKWNKRQWQQQCQFISAGYTFGMKRQWIHDDGTVKIEAYTHHHSHSDSESDSAKGTTQAHTFYPLSYQPNICIENRKKTMVNKNFIHTITHIQTKTARIQTDWFQTEKHT